VGMRYSDVYHRTDMKQPNLNLGDHVVLVTGAAGFLGSHVVRSLSADGVEAVHPVTRRDCDLRRPEDVKSLFDRIEPTVVIHLAAAQGGVAWQKANQATAFLDNSRMMESLVMASVESGVKRFLFTASSICYPADASIPYMEESLWDGPPEPAHMGYARAKRAGIALLQAAHDQYGLSSGVVMPANMYGPGARFEPDRSNVVAATLRKCIEARDRGDASITCWGSGDAIREFLFVEDAARGILRATACLEQPHPLNLGTGLETPIRDLVESACRVTGFTGDVVWDTNRPEGAPRVCMDIARMRHHLEWLPETSLEEGLRRTLAWWEPIHQTTIRS